MRRGRTNNVSSASNDKSRERERDRDKISAAQLVRQIERVGMGELRTQ
jgi:hypothetical protein